MPFYPAGGPPDASMLMHDLAKFAQEGGLTVSRLRANRQGTAERLLGLAAVRRRAGVDRTDLATAAIALVSACVRDDMSDGPQLIADIALALRVHSYAHSSAGLADNAIRGLLADSLPVRRRTLVENWNHLQDESGQNLGNRPSVIDIQKVIEPAALRELAERLIQREIYSAGALTVATSLHQDLVEAATARPHGKILVVGGAVMDATFLTKALPVPETSSQADAFDLSPGGKGLHQAVAAARLGIDVSLLAAIGDDRFGEEILGRLSSEGVDTSLVKIIAGARTSFTGIFERELGDSIAANWRNEAQLTLEASDIDKAAAVITDADALLLTFEVSPEAAARTLEIARSDSSRRPMTIVTPGQPYAAGGLSGRSLTQIDYLVAHAWELEAFAPTGLQRFDPDPVARSLLSRGVESLCLLIGGGCTVYSQVAHATWSVPTFPSVYKETSAARDAFCAALAARLIEDDGVFSWRVALWAAAAMSCAVADFPLTDSMPDRRRIELLLEQSVFRGVN